MKKTIKLSIVFSLFVVFTCVSVIGLWAFVQQKLSMLNKINFLPEAVAGSISASVSGLGGDGIDLNYETQEFAADKKSNDLPEWQMNGANVLFDNSGNPQNIVYKFTITNKTTSSSMQVSVENFNLNSNLQLTAVEFSTDDSAYTAIQKNSDNKYTTTIIAPSGETNYSKIIRVTISVLDKNTPIENGTLSYDIVLTREVTNE